MAGFPCFIFVLLGVFALLLVVHAQDQTGFISIDCGRPANSSYSEQNTGINYISDATFIDTGTSKSVSPEFKVDRQQQVWNLRSFPQGVRNSYRIEDTKGTKYLIRTTFLYGNYDGNNNLPQFDLYFGANTWDTVKVENSTISVIMELIHIPSLDYIDVCLINTGNGVPFISAIELRPLRNTTYKTKSGSLALFFRKDIASKSDKSYRYPYDVFDRIWLPYNTLLWADLSTSLTIDSLKRNDYQLPCVVTSAAATPRNESNPLEFKWDAADTATPYYIFMHFAEVVKLEANQSRSFNISVNGNYWYGPFAPQYLYTNTLYSQSASFGAARYYLSIFKSENPTLSPIINAIEVFSVKDLSEPETHQDDVNAIGKIKSTYGIKRNWRADPCGRKTFPWDGLNCSYADNVPPRILSLSLSSTGLIGEISADISNLVM